MIEHNDLIHQEVPILRRTVWGAILAGVAIALVVQIMFSLLGLAIGMASVDPQVEQQPLSGLGMTTGIWTAVGAVVALFSGGWVAERLAGNPHKSDGLLHGLVTGAVVTMIAVWMMTTAVGRVLNVATGALGSALQAAGQGIAAVVPDNVQLPNVSVTEAKNRAQQFLREMEISQETVNQFVSNATQQLGTAATQAATNPEQAFEEISTALTNIAQRGGNIVQENVDQKDAVDLLVKNTGMTREKAQAAVEQWSQRIQKEYAQATNPADPTLKESLTNTVERTGDKVAGAISSFAAWTFFSILVGLAAAGFGGCLGAPKRLEVART
ncbi:MAG: hypothetical protein H0U23_01810 [Blastocatellia bacterium]|jgi:polyhydroxyalkanoate synthesis regulator phasin|nr:hypothetical protein [Blastocatellia bacterium]